jgi:hypothetical protein
VAEEGATVGEMRVWWVVAVGEKMADGDGHTIFIHRWVWLLCVEKRWKKKIGMYMGSCGGRGREFAAGEMCAWLKAAMGMPAADGDELAIVARFVTECMMEVSVTNIIFSVYPVSVTRVVF